MGFPYIFSSGDWLTFNFSPRAMSGFGLQWLVSPFQCNRYSYSFPFQAPLLIDRRNARVGQNMTARDPLKPSLTCLYFCTNATVLVQHREDFHPISAAGSCTRSKWVQCNVRYRSGGVIPRQAGVHEVLNSGSTPKWQRISLGRSSRKLFYDRFNKSHAEEWRRWQSLVEMAGRSSFLITIDWK